jgi:hypothetical protein
MSFFSSSARGKFRTSNLLLGAAGAALFALASACTATVESAPIVAPGEEVVAVDTVPTNVTVYPHTVYQGRTVYFVNGRWYYPHGRHWYAYRTEPAGLARQRPYVQQAPPAYAPPAYNQAPPAYNQAPPAYRPAPGEAVRVQ